MVELYQMLGSKENITEINPYNINSPVTVSQFFGRERLLASILEMLAVAGQHVLIFGPARYGKTSFLQELMTRLPAEAYAPVCWGVKGQGDLSPSAVWAVLAQTIAGQVGLPASRLPANLDEFCVRFLPRIRKKIAPRRLVLLLDDVDILLDRTAEADGFGQDLPQFLAQEQTLNLVLSTSKKAQALPLALQNIIPPLHYEELPPLTPQETHLLVIEQGKFLPVGFLVKTIDQIWDLTAGHPYYVNFICHETLDYALQEGSKIIDPELLQNTLPFILDKSALDFEKATADLPNPALETVTASAAAVRQELPLTPEGVSQILAQNHKIIEENALSLAFNELETQSILKQEQTGGYSFVVPLMAHWLFVRYLPQTTVEAGPTPAARPRWLQPRWLALAGSGALILLLALIGFAVFMTNNTLATTSAPPTAGLAASLESFTAEPTVTPVTTQESVATPPLPPTLVPVTVEISALLPTITPTLPLTPTATVAPTLAPSPTATPPPTFTAAPTATSVPTLPPPTATPLPTLTPLPAATSAPTLPPATATPLPTVPSPTVPAPPAPATSLPAGSFTLLNPLALDQPSYGLTEFEWQWTGPVPAGTGFEVRVWREGEPQMGVHDAVYDNQHGAIESLGENKYRLRVDITGAAGVQGVRGEYFWTVALVQTSPSYADLGRQAPPARMRFEPKNSSDGGGGGGSSGSVGVN
ncbi:MAG: ATP-binding protein [Anaerolineales bacterium]|nr:ATP-binding protein [Anaerolineales bacterium]